jgi:D-alanyl-lipoteichoic acid acyltransferase DltB (MBOAT superfamily)
MGFELRTNFNFPYVAQSVPEFWRRWHMSLSTWFRDYVYIPMGGSRVGRWRLYFNLAVVFVVSGLWHGAAWTFAIWGALHALFMVLSNVKAELGKRGWRLDSLLPAQLLAAGRLGLTFLLVCYAWIFFRAGSLQDALYIGTHVFAGIGTTAVQLLHHNAASLRGFTGGASNLAIACAALVALLVFEHFQRRGKELFTQPALSWGFMAATLLLIINLAPAQQVPFIYFQF